MVRHIYLPSEIRKMIRMSSHNILILHLTSSPSQCSKTRRQNKIKTDQEGKNKTTIVYRQHDFLCIKSPKLTKKNSKKTPKKTAKKKKDCGVSIKGFGLEGLIWGLSVQTVFQTYDKENSLQVSEDIDGIRNQKYTSVICQHFVLGR